MNILVIGGAGYIGSVVAETLIQKHNIIIYDNLSNGYVASINKKAKFIKADMLNTKFLTKTMKKYEIDLVIALAAKIVVSESTVKPLEYFANNVGGMISILQAMKDANVDKIIFSSTAAVYGQCGLKPVSEEDCKMPINPYGQSKLACEWLIQDAALAWNLKYVIFRFFNVAGATDSLNNGMRNKKPTLLIPCINKAILEKSTPYVYGNKYKTKDGTCLRDYVHVQDLADAHELALDFLNKGHSDIFNLGSNVGYTVLDVINKTMETLNVQFKYLIKEPRKGDPDCLTTSNVKAQKILKWKPKRDLSIMIKSDYLFREKK